MNPTQNIPSSIPEAPPDASPDSCRGVEGAGSVAIGSRARRQKDSGIVAVETALILPVLLLLTFGLIEYGWLFLKSQEITNAARRGARVAVRADATSSDVISAVNNVMTASDLGDSGYQVTITPSVISTTSPGDVITVQITLPYANVSLTGTPIVPTPANVQASVSMAREGP